ncbi:Dolichol phosphate-mannose biosynthesis regulatory protein [Datura stramonium]|uniref:Dolichol phosphate-mannose biosynthesis regulatory protein n=1 Tax=Datura stramonium TaxID=4076 RepID=A0ABS8WS10_DATST|nr:Dolichol phosphate-mannose biosynthesis regulatory protein [Datura stramonium]
MLEGIRLKVMNKFVTHEEEVMSWLSEWSPIDIEMYNEYLNIAKMCVLNFNGDHGFEISEGMTSTLSLYHVRGVVVGYEILLESHVPMPSKHFFTKGLIPRNKYTGEEAMEPPPFVKLVGRPTVKRKRDKDEALKRQSEWVASRKGRVMSCSICGVPGHNA